MKIDRFFLAILILTFLVLVANLIRPIGGERFAQAYSKDDIEFSTTHVGLYFFDATSGKVYKYGNNGRLVNIYQLKELGQDLERVK